jgi:hypothetical protein
MPPPGAGKTLRSESKYPYIVELAVGTDGLDVELSRRIMEFHKSHTFSRDTDVRSLGETGSIIAGALPIC